MSDDGQEYLEKLIASLQRPEHGPLNIEYVDFDGWYLIGEPRDLTDDGRDYAGRNVEDAAAFLRKFLA